MKKEGGRGWKERERKRELGRSQGEKRRKKCSRREEEEEAVDE